MTPLVRTEDLVDAHGVADLLGLSHRNSVSLYQRRYADMPRPVVELGSGRIKLWLRSEIESWASEPHGRGRTRPQGRVVASPDSTDAIREFVLELLGTGSMLSELVSNLVDELPPDAYPGDEPAAVVVEMLWGTIATALAAAEPADVRRAAELIAQARLRTLEHLQLAQALPCRFHGDGPGAGPAHG